MYLNIDKPRILKFHSKPLDQEISFKYERREIWCAWLLFVRCIVNGASYVNIVETWGVSYPTIKKYVDIGYFINLKFYQSYFCSSEYWSHKKLLDSTPPEYSILLGYVIDFIYIL